MPSVKLEKLEERWTSTTIKTVYVLHGDPRKLETIPVDLPLLNLGWTFTLSLTPEHALDRNISLTRKATSRRAASGRWILTAFSFRRQDNAVPWKKTSLHAQLSLAAEKHDETQSAFYFSPSKARSSEDEGSSAKQLATFDVILGDTFSLELPPTLPCTLSMHLPREISLTLKISECPLDNGFFGAYLGLAGEAQVEVRSVKLRSDRLLSRSLTTGRPFDVKFLTNSTRSLSGNTGEPLLTYASLAVLEGHVDMSSSMLRESWTHALATLENTDTKVVREISCPKDCDYELDSDFEDVDEDESPPGDSESGLERDLATFGGQQSERGIERSSSSSSSSLSSFESVERTEEPKQTVTGPPSSYERTIWVKFAAHTTWHAFLWYCYTGNVEFCKLKSQVEPGCRHLRAVSAEGGQPVCSPKSMYRLADLLGNKDLKAKALAAIKARMTETNVVDETFSVFTSKYPNVRKVELAILTQHCESPEVKEAFLRVMEKYGNMLHAKPVLSAFYDNLVSS